MSEKNPLTINAINDDSLALEFSREKFSEFVFSLLATPREEKRIFVGGFDLSLLDVEGLVEKLIHKVTTDHDVLHRDFRAEIEFRDGSRLVVNSYEQFFSTSDYRDEEVVELQVSMSVLIPFNRMQGEKSLEKQTILVTFSAGSNGRITSEIRSTEISWPSGYFSLIERHAQSLSSKIQTANFGNWKNVFFLYKMFIEDENDDVTEKKRRSGRKTTQFILSIYVIMMTIGSVSAIDEAKRSNDGYVYSPAEGNLESIDVAKLLTDGANWKEVAVDLQMTEALIKSGVDEYAGGSAPESRLGSLTKKFLSKTSVVLFIFLSIFAFSNICYALMVSADKAGRIFLFTSDVPKRGKGNYLAGLGTSVFLGVLGSIMATGLLSFLW